MDQNLGDVEQQSSPFREAVKAAPSPFSQPKNEAALEKEQAEVEALKSTARHTDAKTADQKKLTELKETFGAAVMFFLWFWFGALLLGVGIYISTEISLGKEIPKEVIIAMFTTTAVIAGLVGYILKGLFGTKE